MVKLGTVALDGTKIHADASRHSALSWKRACEIEARLRAEVAELMALAEAADAANVPDGMSVPEELARREDRLAAIAEAKAELETRAEERHARERAERATRRPSSPPRAPPPRPATISSAFSPPRSRRKRSPPSRPPVPLLGVSFRRYRPSLDQLADRIGQGCT